MKGKTGRFVAGAAIAIAVLLFVLIAITLRFGNSDKICNGVYVSEIDLSGLSKDQANHIVHEWAIKQAHRNVTLTAMGRRWSGTLADLGVRVDWRDAVNRAYQIGRRGNIFSRVVCVLTSNGGIRRINAKLLINNARLKRSLNKIANVVDEPHKNAKICLVDSRIEIKQDSCGTKLNEASAARIVSKAVLNGENVVALPVVQDMPDVKATDAVGIDTLLASYTTSFNVAKRGRTHNLSLAANSINGVIIKPGQVFSCNSVIGPRIEGRGFQIAQIYIKGKLEDGIGGGVCQVSSTLFNAVLLAGLTIKERSPHSQVIPYVSPGRDATVAYGHRDFRFENSNISPIGVISRVSGNRLTVQIYGSLQDKKEVELYTGKIKHITAGSKTVIDGTLPEGEKRLIEKAVNGIEVVLYRKMFEPDGSAVVESIKSRYAPQKAIIAVGVPKTTAE